MSLFKITDNGVGFTDENMLAFEELDTRFKQKLGGKGVGRLTWLKVFEKAAVDSVYRSSSGFRRRTFDFALPGGIENLADEDIEDTKSVAPGATVTLSGPVEPYREAMRYRSTTVAAALGRHFLSYLISDRPPAIEVIDQDMVIPVAADNVMSRAKSHFDLRGYNFTIDHLKIRSPEKREHAVYYCADYRAVKEERLKHLPAGRLHDDHEEFFYQAYVSSPYLDANVNEQRTAFLLEEESDLTGASFSDLRGEVRRSADNYLEPQLRTLAQERDEQVRRVIDRHLPELKYVTEYNREDISSAISYDATDVQVEEAIGNIHLRNQRTGRELMAGLVNDLQQAVTLDLSSFESTLVQRIEQITRPSQASLASYVLYRRSIIDIYRQILTKPGDRFQREAAIHKLMFPMGVDLDTTRSFLNHNLWLLDERLTFANYIVSDRPLREHSGLFEVNSRAEPDIVCYFNLGFSEDDPALGDLRTAVIVELKRPGPLDSRPENPWQQVMRYIRQMRSGVYNERGQKVKASDHTQFYCFIVCDLDDDKIRAMVEEYTFTPVFDGADGYFLYNNSLKAHAELVPFAKVLRDAELKHRALFERLGLVS